MDPTSIIAFVQGILSTAANTITGIIESSNNAITERRKLVSINISDFINMKTDNNSNLIFILFGIIILFIILKFGKNKHV